MRRNTSTEEDKKAHQPMWNRRTHFQWLGWDDVRRGLPITKARQRDLDNLPWITGPEKNPASILCECYELGRQMAVGYKTEWGVVFEWKRDETFGDACRREVYGQNMDIETLNAASAYHTQFMAMEQIAARNVKEAGL